MIVATAWYGIDVSKFQGQIDWDTVRSMGGKVFAFVSAGVAGADGHIARNYGLDSMFHSNMREAARAGVKTGVYLYSYCRTPQAAVKAARELMDLVMPYEVEYPLALQYEDTSDSGVRYDKFTREQNTAIVRSFCDSVIDNGYYPLLYSYNAFASSYLDMEALADIDFWLAEYSTRPTYGGAYDVWQYTGSGTCPGVNAPCDLSVSYKDYAAIIRREGLNHLGEPTLQHCAVEDLQARVVELEEAIARIGDVVLGTQHIA